MASAGAVSAYKAAVDITRLGTAALGTAAQTNGSLGAAKKLVGRCYQAPEAFGELADADARVKQRAWPFRGSSMKTPCFPVPYS